MSYEFLTQQYQQNQGIGVKMTPIDSVLRDEILGFHFITKLW